MSISVFPAPSAAIPLGVTLKQTITSSGAVTVPAGTELVYAVVIGGGGGGGGAGGGNGNLSSGQSGGGGGAGSGGNSGYMVQVWVSAPSTCTLGAGGTSGTAGTGGNNAVG